MNKVDIDFQRLVFNEKTKMLKQQAAVNVVVNVVVGTIVAFFMARGQWTVDKWVWLALLWLSAIVQIIDLIRRWRLVIDDFRAQQFLRICMFTSLISGVFWATLGILFVEIQPNSIDVYIMITIICGVIAACLSSTSLFLILYFLFSVPIIVAFVTMLLWSMNSDYLIMSGLIVIYYLMCTNLAWIMNRQMNESFQLRFENIEVLKELKVQKEVAEKANVSKSKFLASASHDLRQPLHALGFFIDALRISPARSESLFEKIDTSIISLDSLFDSLLDISKLDADAVEVNKTHFELSELLSKLVVIYGAEASQKNLSFEVEQTSEIIYSDINLLERIFTNLVGNAIRYTEHGGIQVSVEKPDQQKVMIKVSDTGIGIEKSEKEKIFDEFYQLNNPERDRRKGLGLGLSIVKRLCELLDLKLRVESELGEGACFSLMLPLGKRELVSMRSISTPYQEQNLNGKRILVIDDEVDIREAMHQTLTDWGCDVVCCESGVQAKQEIRNSNSDIDLIISDLRLRGEENGIQVLDSLLSIDGMDNTTGILISGDTAPERIAQANESGYRLLHKPLRPAVLRLHLNRLLKGN